jgi:hypothetical protein
LQVAQAKAAAFSKKISTYCASFAQELNLLTNQNQAVLFACSGSSSSFKFGAVTIKFKTVCARKLSWSESPAGQAIRALWYLGKANLTPANIYKATRNCRHQDIVEIRRGAARIPDWLNAHFLHPSARWISSAPA